MVFTRNNLDWWCKRAILFLILGMLVFAPLPFGSVDPVPLLVLQGLGLCAFLFWAARLWLREQSRLLWPPVAWAVLAFLIYAVGRYFTADIEYVARQEVLQVLLFAGVFFTVLNNLRGQEETEAVSFTLIVLATCISGYAIVQSVTHSDRVWNVHTLNNTRASGTYISPNHFAGFLELLLPLALAFLLVGRVKIIPRILLGYAVLMMFAGLAVTFSRAGWVAATAGIFLVLGVLLFHRNHRWPAMILLVLMLGAGSIFVSAYLSKTTGYQYRVIRPTAESPSRFDWYSRFEMWRMAGQMWQDHFWWGAGPAHFDYRYREYRPVDFQLRPNRCHNDYLNLLADWGTTGGLIVLGGMVLVVVGSFKTWPHVRREENSFGRSQSNRFAFFLGAVGGLFALAVHSTMDFNLHIPANALIAVTLLALLTAHLRYASEQYWVRVRVPLKLGMAGALTLVAAYLALQDSRLGRQAFLLARAGQQGDFSPERAAALTQAFAAEPQNFETAYDIGECYRTESLDGGDDFRALATQANEWYAKAIRLNPYDGYSYLRTGMCLDWLGEHAGAEPWYSKAELLDPNGYYMADNIAWHYVQIGDYSAARQYFTRSLKLYNVNPTARNYILICEERMIDRASGKPQLPSFY
jgi:O-antigen ligase